MWIRKHSDENKNCYFVGLFACCREILRPDKHTNCKSLQAHEKEIEEEKVKQVTEQDSAEEEESKEITQKLVMKRLKNGISLLIKTSKDAKNTEEKEEGRGTGCLEIPMPANFLLVYGAKPGNIVSTDTKLIQEVMDMFEKFYDRETLTALFPEILGSLQGSDSNIEIVQSSML